MISKESMRVVLIASKMLLERHNNRIQSIEIDISIRRDTLKYAKTEGARTRTRNNIVALQKDLDAVNIKKKEVDRAINELRATELGTEVWEELENEHS